MREDENGNEGGMLPQDPDNMERQKIGERTENENTSTTKGKFSFDSGWWKRLPLKIKLMIIGGSISVAIILIIIVAVIGGNLGSSYTYDLPKSYIKGTSTESELVDYLINRGFCKNYSDRSKTEQRCLSSDAATFWKSFKNTYDSYQEEKNVMLDVDVLVATVSYRRSDENMYNTQAYHVAYEVELLADAMVKEEEIETTNPETGEVEKEIVYSIDMEKYKEYIVGKTPEEDPLEINFYYLGLFRSNLLNYKLTDSPQKRYEKRLQIYDEIIELSKLTDEAKNKANFGSYGSACTEVTVTGANGGTYPLEEYIAGVLAHEVNSSWGSEALKAQAVAARTYVLSRTNNCTKSISNSQGDQTFKPTTEQALITAAQETAGQVLTYDGDIFSAEYASWWGNGRSSSCLSYIPCTNGQCSITLKKLPAGESWTFTMPKNYFTYGSVSSSSGFDPKDLGGHCRGMTQFGAKYLDLGEGMNYVDILKTFYSDGVEISTMQSLFNIAGGVSLPFKVPSGKSWTQYITRGFDMQNAACYNNGLFQNTNTCAHNGIDFGLPTGTPVYSIAYGKVISSEIGALGSITAGNGNYVIIGYDPNNDGKYEYYALYAHLDSRSVAKGDIVNPGQEIGKVGSTGNSSGPHLHFSISKDNIVSYVDPTSYLNDIVNGKSDLAQSTSGQEFTCNYYSADQISQLNSRLQIAVNSAGYQTGNGVAEAAKFLATQVAHLPYFWGGRNMNTGIHSNWGCSTKISATGSEAQPSGTSWPFGMDCSGFAVWAIRNAGIDISGMNTTGLYGLGNKIPFASAVSQARPGDLVWRGSTSPRVSGKHVGIIIATNPATNQYLIAQETGAATGMEYGWISATSNFTYVIQMSDYYSNHKM